jgi:hypothetical protein
VLLGCREYASRAAFTRFLHRVTEQSNRLAAELAVLPLPAQRLGVHKRPYPKARFLTNSRCISSAALCLSSPRHRTLSEVAPGSVRILPGKTTGHSPRLQASRTAALTEGRFGTGSPRKGWFSTLMAKPAEPFSTPVHKGEQPTSHLAMLLC